MQYWEKIKSYFLDGYDVFSLEIQHKIEYLFYFNSFAIGGLIVYYITRIFNPADYFVLAGDFCLFLFIATSLVAIRLKKIYNVTFSVIFIPIAILFYNVVSSYVIDKEISQISIFSTLSSLMFGLLYLALFSVRINQLIFFTLISAATLILNCFFIINGPFGFSVTDSAIFYLIGALIELGAGYLIAVMILRLNINLLKTTEKKLIQSREQYATLFSNIVDAFGLVKIIKDDTGRPVDIMILEVNRASEKLLKVTRDQVVFRKISEILNPNLTDTGAWLKDISSVACTGNEIHKTFYSKNLKLWFNVQIFSPELNYCALLFRDITTKVESDYALKRIQERNIALLEAIPDTLLVCNKDGLIITYKRAPVKLIENESVFEAGSYVSKANLPAELIGQLLNSIAEVFQSNMLKTLVLEIPTGARIVYAETRLLPLGNNEVLILFRDLTRRVLSEKALKIEKEKAEESDRLKMAFLSNMSHEIRTPMNAIIGFSELLGFSDIDDKERNEFIYQIQSNGALLLNLINDILDLSKIEAGELEMHYSNFDINQIIKDIYLNFENEKTVREKFGIKILVEKQADIKTISVNADEYRFKQIWFNLMGNALKFTTMGSITLGYKLDDKEIIFFVKDTGIGIAKEKQELVFHRFRQVDDSSTRTFGGAGLGLTISRNLVEAMGGRIWVESNDHIGTSFYFTLPLKNATITYTDNSFVSPVKIQHDWKGKSILIIEEESSNYVVIENILSHTGVNMEWASGKQVVLAKCEAHKPDLVIFDTAITVNQDENIEEALKKRYPGLPIIALKSADTKMNGQLLSDHIDFFIEKPIKPQILLETINKFLVTE